MNKSSTYDLIIKGQLVRAYPLIIGGIWGTTLMEGMKGGRKRPLVRYLAMVAIAAESAEPKAIEEMSPPISDSAKEAITRDKQPFSAPKS
jgi:hypothetical protein